VKHKTRTASWHRNLYAEDPAADLIKPSSDPLYYSTVYKRPVFNFDQTRSGKPYYPSSETEATNARIQRMREVERVVAEDPAAVAVQVFLCARHEFAVTSAQQRADEAALRKLLISFLISRLDAKNALAVWDLGDRAAAQELSGEEEEQQQPPQAQPREGGRSEAWRLGYSRASLLL